MSISLKNSHIITIAGIICLFILIGCSSNRQSSTQNPTENSAKEESPIYKPSSLVIQRQDEYKYPEIGLKFLLPEKLMEKMDKQEVAMISEGKEGTEKDAIEYALFSWNIMTKEQRDAEVTDTSNGFEEWAGGLERVGVLGMYKKYFTKDLDKITKCQQHTEIGKSKDGVYVYYLSINPMADKELSKAISEIKAEITEFIQKNGSTGSMLTGNLGQFSIKDINGKIFTEEMFEEHKITMINLFTTWCSPCINEIPDLQKLYEQMSGEGVNIVGIVLDAADSSGNEDAKVIEKAKLLAERTKAAYPFLIPDKSMLNGRLEGIEAIPETFFVDKDGTMIGQVYSGSRSLEGWKKIIESELASIGRKEQ